ncbi:MAG TPA: hypothetical protein VG410_15550 [Solirubrobacteraceae bacterium]|jgi:hypothetical protein|nr:hypothetical protein [Solirubrobacteraceae bacterium]
MRNELPYIDTHTVTVAAASEEAFDAVARTIPRAGSSGPLSLYARLIGCEHGKPFSVAASRRPTELVLAGRHRFSRYELVFQFAPRGAATTVVSATTHAAFPGLGGRLYRAAVIGSGGHRIAMRAMLADLRRRAERDSRSGAAAR